MMRMSKCYCPYCKEDVSESVEEIIVRHIEAIMKANSDTELEDVFFSLYNTGHTDGIKEALSHGIERDSETLRFMNNRK